MAVESRDSTYSTFLGPASNELAEISKKYPFFVSVADREIVTEKGSDVMGKRRA